MNFSRFHREALAIFLVPIIAHGMEHGIEIIKLDQQKWYKAEDNAQAQELASPRNSRAQKLSIANIIIPAGVSVIEHHHQVMEEIYHVLSGSAIMCINGVKQRIVKGDTVVILPGERHSLHNDTLDDFLMTVTCTPPWTPESLIFEKESI